MGLPILAMLAVMAITPTDASAADRTLKLLNVHTKEKAEITFKRNGRYDSGGLKKINHFLRDWRRDEPTKIDPQLLDIVWEAYRQAGTREYIHVISGYRSPKTNAMLRRTRGGQAKKSQHMLGKAMDFYIPGVKLSKLREIGFKLQGGGVGFYPRSGSPFVHFDTGNVRAWPRMSRAELARVFPKGNTLHLPADGNPLPGYQTAMAAYKQRKANGVAYAGGSSTSSGGGGGKFLASLFGGGDDDEAEDTGETMIASAAPPQAAAVLPGVAVAAAPRPAASVASAPVASRPAAPAPAEAEVNPAQLLAALPASAVPLPVVSPRRSGPPLPPGSIPAAAPAVAATMVTDPADDQPADARDEVGALIAAANIPLPLPRPERSRSATTASIMAMASAPEISNGGVEAANAVAAAADDDLSVPLPVRRPSSDAISLLAALDTTPAEGSSAMIPVSAEPRATRVSSDQSRGSLSFASAGGSRRNGRVTEAEGTELAMTDIPTSRRVRADMVAPALGTSPTAARPSKADAEALEAQRREALVHLNDIDQARWALRVAAPHIQKKEAAATRSLRTPPRQIVITAFTQEPAHRIPNAFQGSAINFQTVARFER